MYFGNAVGIPGLGKHPKEAAVGRIFWLHDDESKHDCVVMLFLYQNQCRDIKGDITTVPAHANGS